jgi:hypothetical protein
LTLRYVLPWVGGDIVRCSGVPSLIYPVAVFFVQVPYLFVGKGFMCVDPCIRVQRIPFSGDWVLGVWSCFHDFPPSRPYHVLASLFCGTTIVISYPVSFFNGGVVSDQASCIIARSLRPVVATILWEWSRWDSHILLQAVRNLFGNVQHMSFLACFAFHIATILS